MFVAIILITSIISCSTVYSSYMMKLYSKCHIPYSNTPKVPPLSTRRIIEEKCLEKVSSALLNSRKIIEHMRVRRWQEDETNLKTIRTFVDKGNTLYKDLSDELILEQHAFHTMGPTIPFLGYLVKQGDQDKYFSDSKKGIQAKTSLVVRLKEKDKLLYPNGRLKINIDTNYPKGILVYHNMFHANNHKPKKELSSQLSDKTFYENENRANKSPSPQYGKQKIKNETFLTEDKDNGYRILKKEDDYIIEYILGQESPYKSKRLYIHTISSSSSRKGCLGPYVQWLLERLGMTNS